MKYIYRVWYLDGCYGSELLKEFETSKEARQFRNKWSKEHKEDLEFWHDDIDSYYPECVCDRITLKDWKDGIK